MHKYLRAAGFSMYTKKKDIDKLLDLLERQPSVTKCVQVDEESNVCEMRTEVAPGLGISIVGELKEEGNFEREYYFPYLESNVVGSTEECSVQRHTEKETYAGMVDENRVGITLIFYIQNFLDFRERKCWIKSTTPESDRSAFLACPSAERSFFQSRKARNRSRRQKFPQKNAAACRGRKKRGRGRHGDPDHRGY